MIRFSNFRKRFRTSPEDVLDIQNLVLPKKVYWLKGNNGGGKTSLLKSVAGVIPFEGEITVDDIAINNDRMTYRMIVNYAEAEPVYPEFLRGKDLLDLYVYSKQATAERVTSLVKRFEISSYIENKIGSYSSGMIKKLSLLLAFIGSSKLVLLDEPFITLDQQAIKIVEETIAEFYAAGSAFIIATHQDFMLPGSLQATPISLVNKTILME